MALNLTAFGTRDAASAAAAAQAAKFIDADLSEFGTASLMASGGSSPERMFEMLSAKALDWKKVTLGLVDERWVSPDHPDSNERLVRSRLLQGEAKLAEFIPMKTAHAHPIDAAPDRNAAYAPHCRAISFLLLGMGTDGHTASWFPGLPNLEEIVSPDLPRYVAAVEAPLATVPQRMTLTGAAVLNARRAALLVFGEEKRSMLLGLDEADPVDRPVRFAVYGLGDRLSVFWAP